MSANSLSAREVATRRGREDPRTFLFRLTVIASLGGLLFGFDTGVISGALVYLHETFQLTPVSEGLVVTSLLFPGATAGALLGGSLADWVGRKQSLVIAGVIFLISTLACALAPNVALLVVGRIVLGFAVGVASVVVPLYLAEMAPASQRGRIVTVNQLMLVIGLFLAFVINALLASLINDPAVWRYMLGAAMIPAAGLLFGMLTLPDTPRWYASKGRLPEARRTLQRAHLAERVEAEYKQITDLVEADASKGEVSASATLRAEPWMRRPDRGRHHPGGRAADHRYQRGHVLRAHRAAGFRSHAVRVTARLRDRRDRDDRLHGGGHVDPGSHGASQDDAPRLQWRCHLAPRAPPQLPAAGVRPAVVPDPAVHAAGDGLHGHLPGNHGIPRALRAVPVADPRIRHGCFARRTVGRQLPHLLLVPHP